MGDRIGVRRDSPQRGAVTGSWARGSGQISGKYAGNMETPGDALSMGRIELAEVTGVQYAPLQAGGVARYFPLATLPPESAGPNQPARKRPRLAALDAELAERARYESLRDLAVAHDVSHETIRAALRRQHRHDLAAPTGT